MVTFKYSYKSRIKVNQQQKEKIDNSIFVINQLYNFLYELKNKDLNIKKFKVKTATISRKNGKYYISLAGDKEFEYRFPENPIKVGIDVNFETIALLNNIEYQLKNLQNKLNLYTKELEKLKQEKSKRLELNKEILKLQCKTDNIAMYNGKKLTREAKVLYRAILSEDKIYNGLLKQINKRYEKRTNVQEDLYKKIAYDISNNYDLCFIEDLDINNMVNKKVKNQNLYNAALGKLLLILENKIRTTEKVIKVKPQYTSKTCNSCGKIVKLKLSDRIWICECGSKNHRDINAAKNIYDRGLKLWEQSLNVPACTIAASGSLTL